MTKITARKTRQTSIISRQTYQPDEVVVHVARVPQRRRRRRHHGGHERVRLLHGRVLNVEAVDGNVVQRGVVKDDLERYKPYAISSRTTWKRKTVQTISD